jgi:Protein of unknown function (DUF1573)
MKNVFFSILTLFILGCSSNNNSTEITSDEVSNNASADGKINGDLPNMKFDEVVYDFGKITQGEKVSHEFTFTNNGKKNLIISGASGSCGCTVPEWPKEPIPANGSGKINVVFSSEGKRGLQEKTVTIVTNCEPSTKIIKIKADVIVAETAK